MSTETFTDLFGEAAPVKPDHDHTMTVEWDGWRATYRLKCSADASAMCRADWKCECESFGDHGIDAQGPWHETCIEYVGDDSERHYGDFGGECTYALWINEGDAEDLGHGSITFPVEMEWEGSGYDWHPIEVKP